MTDDRTTHHAEWERLDHASAQLDRRRTAVREGERELIEAVEPILLRGMRQWKWHFQDVNGGQLVVGFRQNHANLMRFLRNLGEPVPEAHVLGKGKIGLDRDGRLRCRFNPPDPIGDLVEFARESQLHVNWSPLVTLFEQQEQALFRLRTTLMNANIGGFQAP